MQIIKNWDGVKKLKLSVKYSREPVKEVCQGGAGLICEKIEFNAKVNFSNPEKTRRSLEFKGTGSVSGSSERTTQIKFSDDSVTKSKASGSAPRIKKASLSIGLPYYAIRIFQSRGKLPKNMPRYNFGVRIEYDEIFRGYSKYGPFQDSKTERTIENISISGRDDLTASGRVLRGKKENKTVFYTETITWTIEPGQFEPDNITIRGPKCVCFNLEEPQVFSFEAGAGNLSGTFKEFEIKSEGEKPRILTNKGGKTAFLEIKPTRGTRKTTIKAIYNLNGVIFTEQKQISFCGIDKPKYDDDTSDISFNRGTPGIAKVNTQSKVFYNGNDKTEKLKWELAEMGDGTELKMIEEKGAKGKFEYRHLPASNTSFGDKQVKLKFKEGDCDCERQEVVRIFFNPLETNHPGPDNTPNWFYYWKQTGANPVSEEILKYQAHIPTLNKPTDNVLGRYLRGKNLILVGDVYNSTTCTQRARGIRGAKNAAGIDCFAELIRHENQHRVEYTQWWAHRTGAFDKALWVDFDSDYVPAVIEKKYTGCSDMAQYSCPIGLGPGKRPFKDATDAEIFAYDVGWSWPLGNALEEDFSCGKKNPKWTGVACP